MRGELNSIVDRETPISIHSSMWDLPAMYLSNSIPAYVYRIENLITGDFYWGSRYQHIRFKRLPSDDLWKYYFTSSEAVGNLIEQYGKDSWICDIMFTSINTDEVFWWEQSRISENISNPRCLNGYFIDRKTNSKVFLGLGESNGAKGELARKKISNALVGRVMTQEHKDNIAKSKLGQNKGKSYEEIYGVDKGLELRMLRSTQLIGKEKSIKACANLAKAFVGRKTITNGIETHWHNPDDPLPEGFRYGRPPKSDAHRSASSASQKGRIQPKVVCRIEDQKEMTIQNFLQWTKGAFKGSKT